MRLNRLVPVLAAMALLVLATSATAQVSTRGTDFWACDLENTEGGVNEPFGILVANSGVADSFVTIEVSTGLLDSATVTPGSLATFTFDRSRMMTGTSRAPNAYHVLATEPVTVYQFNPLSTMNVNTNDASTVLPVPSLGTEYRPLSREQVSAGGDLPGLIAVIGLSVTPTNVRLIPQGWVRSGFVPTGAPGAPIDFTLGRFEVAQFMTDGTFRSDLTGSLVTSDRPVAVFGGSRCSFVPSGVRACDHLEEAMFPVTAWGRDFLAVKSPPRASEPDIFRVVATEADTVVNVTPDRIGSPQTLQPGESLEFETTTDVHIVADKPIEVGQYLVGADYDPTARSGDPSLILVIPTEQFDTSYVFLTPDTYDRDYAVIVKPAAATVDLDGVAIPAASFTPIGTTGYSRVYMSVDDGVHVVNASAGVGVYIIGYASYASYGYYAGAKSEDINSPIECDPGGPYSVGCGGGASMLDGTGSSGPGPLSYLWSALTPGLTITTPTSATSPITASGAGPWNVSLTVTSGVDSSTCIATITGSNDVVAPVVLCPAQVDAVPTDPAGAFVSIAGEVSDDCDPGPALTNDRTPLGGDASGIYPCGETLVTFTGTDDSGNTATCTTRVVVTPAGPPTEPSASGVLSWLRVAKTRGNPLLLDLTMEIPGDAATRVNLMQGTILPTRFVAYDHVPLQCHVAPLTVAPGVGLLQAPLDPGTSHYFLVSASNCLAEGTRGSRSDGVARPDLPTDCGPLP